MIELSQILADTFIACLTYGLFQSVLRGVS